MPCDIVTDLGGRDHVEVAVAVKVGREDPPGEPNRIGNDLLGTEIHGARPGNVAR